VNPVAVMLDGSVAPPWAEDFARLLIDENKRLVQSGSELAVNLHGGEGFALIKYARELEGSREIRMTFPVPFEYLDATRLAKDDIEKRSFIQYLPVDETTEGIPEHYVFYTWEMPLPNGAWAFVADREESGEFTRQQFRLATQWFVPVPKEKVA
jgi:hypothetical protein